MAEETIQPNEERDVQAMIDTMRDHLIQDFPPEKMERAGNTKTHGVVRAECLRCSDEAIQPASDAALDCFATLAMTVRPARCTSAP
ncbi:MAG: hypothetical protein ABIW83_02665 [Allosphingosinicella sp.]